jgi:hypothetical protein
MSAGTERHFPFGNACELRSVVERFRSTRGADFVIVTKTGASSTSSVLVLYYSSFNWVSN